MSTEHPSAAATSAAKQELGGGGGGEAPNAPTSTSYPPPTAHYEDVAQNSDLFWENLHSFHNSFGTKFAVPTVGGKALALHHLFVEVTSRGGIEKVIKERRWKEVTAAFNFPSTITSASFVLRKYYMSLLYHFEQAYLFQKQVPSVSMGVNGSLGNASAGSSEGAAATSQFSEGPDLQLGCLVTGTIDGKFDDGYVVNVEFGSNKLIGVLYQIPDSFQVSHGSHTLDLPPRQHRKRSRLLLRDPTRPKSNRSGYNFFFAEHYAQLKPFHHGQERVISKKIGHLWNNLTEAEKQVYQEKGFKDRERYRTEMLEYRSYTH